MAVKKCDDIAQEATEEAQSVQEKQTKKPKKRQSKTKLPVYLGKSLKLVERGVYDDMLGESGILLETGMFNVVETFGNGGIRAMRPSDIEDALRAELRTFFATDENGQMKYLNERIDGSGWWLIHSHAKYGNPAIGIKALEEPREVEADQETRLFMGPQGPEEIVIGTKLFKKYQQNFEVTSNRFVSNTDGSSPLSIMETALQEAFQVFALGGQVEALNFSRNSPLIDLATEFTDHYTSISAPFSKDELENFVNRINNPMSADVEGDYDFYIREYENKIKSSLIKETLLPNIYSIMTQDDNYKQKEHAQGKPNKSKPKDYFGTWARKTNPKMRNRVGRKYQNILIPSEKVSTFFKYNENENLFPMNVNVEIQTDKTGDLLLASDMAGMTDNIMKFVTNETLQGIQAAGSLPPNVVAYLKNEIPFAVSTEQISVVDGKYRYRTELNQQNIQIIDLEPWLRALFDEDTYYYEFPDFKEKTIFLGVPPNQSEESGECNAFADTLKSLILIGKINQIVQDRFRTFEEMLKGQEAYNETLVYEIVKSSRQSGARPIQRFFIPNTEEVSVLKYVDTQVKYDKAYKYEIFAHQLIVGTKYKYLAINEATSILPDNENRVIKFGVEYQPSLQIARIPIFIQQARILDNAPVFPNVDLIPYKEVSDRFLINLSSNSGDYTLPPIIINDKDEKFVTNYRQARKLTANDPINFLSDDPTGRFEIYRIETPPDSYESFRGSLQAIVGSLKVSSASFIDKITPNKKYYYMFRAIDVHGNRSNPTDVYEVQIVENSGVIFFNNKVYNFSERSDIISERSSATKDFRRFIRISPNFIQSLINYEQSFANVDDNSTAYNSVEPPVMGLSDESVWDKRFKLRVTSKHSGKKVDINFKCKVKYTKTESEQS
jgi:hypothetical protein